MKILVISGTYNESGNIAAMIGEVMAFQGMLSEAVGIFDCGVTLFGYR